MFKMTEAEKELLIYDLCMRLPFTPKILIEWDIDGKVISSFATISYDDIEEIVFHIQNDNLRVKPVLVPMDALDEQMTDDIKNLSKRKGKHHMAQYGLITKRLLGCHADINGLIDRGMAIAAETTKI